METLSKILEVIYTILFEPVDADVLTSQYIVAIRCLVELNDSILNINYIDFADTILRSLIQLSRNVVLPVAYAILAYMMVVELYTLFTKTEGMSGASALQMPLKIVIKIVIFKVLIDRAHDLLEAIFLLVMKIQNEIFGYTIAYSVSTESINNFHDEVAKMSFVQRLFMVQEVRIYTLLSSLAIVVATVVAIARVFEIYIYVFLSPIPLATLAGGEMSQIGKSFLKGFTAVCVQGVIIAIIIFLYSQFIKVFVLGDTLKEQFWKSMAAVSTLIFCLFSSSRWAKAVCGSM